MKKCFIVCPIGIEGSDTRSRSDKLNRHIITPVCEKCGFEPIRIDEENKNGSLIEDIHKHLQEDELVIADLTENNPNAFYEIGYRAALGKPSIHLMMKDSTIPFDISAIRAYTYDLCDLDSVENLKERLVQTINGINIPQDENETSVANITNNYVTSVNHSNFELFQEIYRIQDSIEKLTDLVRIKNTDTVSILADKIASSGNKSPEAIMSEIIVSKLVENPDQFQNILTTINKLQK